MKRIEKKTNMSDTKVKNLFYFTDRILRFAYDITIDNHKSNHEHSIMSFVSTFKIQALIYFKIRGCWKYWLNMVMMEKL